MNEADFMWEAIAVARRGIALGQSPFGAVIVTGGSVLVATHNTVWRDFDPTAHAETNCIRAAGGLLQSIDFSDGEMYTTCEPCPMCLAAIHWAKLRRVVFGATIADAERAGFSELSLPAKHLAALGGSPLIVEDGLLTAECAALFDEWLTAAKGQSY